MAKPEARHVSALPGKLVGTDIVATERNGFTHFDITADKIEVRQFRWRPPDPLEAIATLQRAHSVTIGRLG